MLESEGLSLIAFSPLAGGYLTGKYRDGACYGRRATIQFPPVDESRGAQLLSVMDTIATQKGVSMEAIALAWLNHQPVVSSTILGLRNIHQLEANLAAIDVKLSDEECTLLAEASALPFEYPGWMIANDSKSRRELLETGIAEQTKLPRQ